MDPLSITTDHGGLGVLASAECDRLLSENEIGRIAFVVAGEPTILPVNYRYTSGTIVFLTTAGEKLTIAARGTPAAFEVDGFEPSTRTGWSVVVRGLMETVTDPTERTSLDQLGLEPWTHGVPRQDWIRIRPYEITGRAVLGAQST